VRPADHSSRGVLQTVVCRMNVIAKLAPGSHDLEPDRSAKE